MVCLERLNYFVNNNPWDGLSVRVSGFEYTVQMRAELEAFTNSIDDCIDVLTTINELPDICDQAQYISILEIAELIENICDLPQIPEIWLGAFDFEQGIKSASDAKNTYTKLYDLREAISKVFMDTIYHYNYNEWKEKLLAQANGFVDLPLISRKDSVFFVKEAVALHAHFTNLKNALMDAKNTYKAINEKLGTDFATNAYNQQTVVSLFDLIRSNVILNKIWFSSDIAKIRTLVIETQAVANDIKSVKEKLLTAWEPEILGLDYAPILLRYKTEYTNIFKVFKGQYKQDKKQIQALSKTVLKKLPDDAVVELLTVLKLYHDTKL